MNNLNLTNALGKNPLNMKPLTEAELWALAAGGVLTENSRDHFDRLASRHGPRVSEACLAESWGAIDRKTLKETIQWLQLDGHRAQLPLHIQNAERLSGEGQIHIADRHTKFVAENLNSIQKFGLISWDYGRLINVARWGYTTNYLTESEAWSYIKFAAFTIRTKFNSWSETGEDFMLGFHFWALGIEPGFSPEDAYNRLLNQPGSPWRSIDWNIAPESLQEQNRKKT